MTKIKICGLTNLNDALFAANAGADYLGFIFYKKSPRFIDVREASSIISKLPNQIKKVGVFVNQTEEEIGKAVEMCHLDYVQLHGDESPDFIVKVNVPVIKSFRLKDENSLTGIEDYDVFANLFDTYSDNQFGGTGKTFDLSLLENKLFNKPFFLSGGLNAENVGEAIRKIKPFSVDVASGVEKSPGLKDHFKIERFIQSVLSTTYEPRTTNHGA